MRYPEATSRYELYKILVEKGISKYWADRAIELITHVLEDRGGAMQAVTGIRVTSRYWPLSGMIKFTRMLDGQVFKAYLKNKTFLVKKG